MPEWNMAEWSNENSNKIALWAFDGLKIYNVETEMESRTCELATSNETKF